MKNKLKILLVFLILILSIGMVSATESVSTDSDVNDGNEYLANQVTDVDIVSESDDIGTFTELNDLISNAENGVVNLEKDYKYDSSKDGKYRVGIQTDDIVINGNNHTIDGSHLARIFTQYSGAVTLKDINFVNGFVSNRNNGGAYLLNTGNLTVINCQFENNYAGRHGGAIGVASNYHSNPINIYNSSFINNSAQFNGGSVYASELVVDNSYFELNRILTRSSTDFTLIEQKGLGGAICSVDSKIRNSLFKNNRVLNSGYYQIEEGGGAITSLKVLTVENSDFINNTALKGGAIFGIAAFDSYLNPSNYVKILDSTFLDNVAQSGGAVCSNFNMTVDKSVFNNNTASGYGGGAINTGFKSNDNNFTNSNFTNNLAFNYGGAISSSHSHVNNCLFDSNEANHGGAIFSLSFDVKNSQFRNNVGVLGNETIVVVDSMVNENNKGLIGTDIKVYDQHKVQDYSKDVLNGNPANTKYIPTGNYAGYEAFCIEQHLFYPDNTEGVMVKDLTYISNSIDKTLVGEYVRILFYLLDAYPEKYESYSLADIQDVIWIFTDGNYKNSNDKLIKDVLQAYDEGNIEFNETTYVLPNGTLMEYDMQIFLTPTDRQNMVLFKSQPFVPRYNETVKKDTINQTVLVGQNVEFRVTVTNNGNMPLEDVFVSDLQYSKGLTYDSWRNDKGSWTFKNNGKWVLNYILEPGENASLIVIFKTSVLGNLTNTVTSGYKNITLANSTNVTETLANPKLSVQKIANKEKVNPNDEVSFDIIVRNVGEYECTGVYVVDNQYSKGLIYDYYVDPTDSWLYKGNKRWEYNKVLKVGEETKLILFFMVKTKQLGLLNNTVIVGNNMTNETESSTNHTNVTKPNETDTPEKENITKHNKTTTSVFKSHKFSDRNATGNPLFALILVLISLGAITSRRK